MNSTVCAVRFCDKTPEASGFCREHPTEAKAYWTQARADAVIHCEACGRRTESATPEKDRAGWRLCYDCEKKGETYGFRQTLPHVTPKAVQLVAINGHLHTPNEAIVDDLQRRYFGAEPVMLVNDDPNSVPWPFPNDATVHFRRILAEALYDGREMGIIPSDTSVVLLPDGAEFHIDREIMLPCDHLAPHDRDSEGNVCCAACGDRIPDPPADE